MGVSFEGTKPLPCASVEAIDCNPGEKCESGIPEMIDAPQFLRIDFAKKEIIGPLRTAKSLAPGSQVVCPATISNRMRHSSQMAGTCQKRKEVANISIFFPVASFAPNIA